MEPILVRGEPAVLSEVYRSTSGGWVVERDESDDGVVVTLRLAHQFQELRGLNMLAALFDGLEFPEMVEELFAVHMQSDIIHSHLEIAGSQGQVAAAMNGLWATLPATFDRRFPLVRESMIGGDLPPYTIQPPPVSVRQGGRFVAWNSPYSHDFPYGSVYTYGGSWRCEWLCQYLDSGAAEQKQQRQQQGEVVRRNSSSQSSASTKAYEGLVARADRGAALSLGGGSGQVSSRTAPPLN